MFVACPSPVPLPPARSLRPRSTGFRLNSGPKPSVSRIWAQATPTGFREAEASSRSASPRIACRAHVTAAGSIMTAEVAGCDSLRAGMRQLSRRERIAQLGAKRPVHRIRPDLQASTARLLLLHSTEARVSPAVHPFELPESSYGYGPQAIHLGLVEVITLAVVARLRPQLLDSRCSAHYGLISPGACPPALMTRAARACASGTAR